MDNKAALIKRNHAKVLGIIIFTIWVAATAYAIVMYLKPLNIEERVLDNKININTKFDYKVSVKKSALFPDGGIVSPEGIIFCRITDSIIVDANSDIISDKPVNIDGNIKVYLKLIAKDLWEREYVLMENKKIRLSGRNNNILGSESVINLSNIMAFMEKVEKETRASPENYLLKVVPVFEGAITYSGNNIKFDGIPELVFEANFNGLKLVGEKENNKEIVLEEVNQITNIVYIFGNKVSVSTARSALTAVSIVLLAVLAIVIRRKSPVKQKDSETETIDKKYNSRLVSIENDIDVSGKTLIIIKTMKTLAQMADDKECPILRFENGEKSKVGYYIVDNLYIYKYEVSCGYGGPAETEAKIITSGSEISYD